MKTPSKLAIERNFLNLIKGIYKESTADSKLKGERQNDVFLRSGRGQGYHFYPIL